MSIWASVTTLGMIAAIGVAGARSVQAAEVTILANQGAVSLVRDLAAAFEKESGNKIVVIFAQGAAMTEKINSGTPADLVSLFLNQFDDFAKRGKVVPGTPVEYVRVGNGLAVKAGAPKPNISTPEAFKQAILDAKSIGYSNNGTGPLNTKLFQRLGIYDQIKDKIKIINGGPIAKSVAAGEVEIGIQQTNVIQPYPGTDYLGPVPPELMEYGHIGVGLLTIAKEKEAAKAFMKFMTSPEAAPIIRKGFMEPPAG